eukprot:UN01282
MWPNHVMHGMQPMVYNSFRTPSPSPVLLTPSASPLPIVAPNVMPVSIPSNSAEGLGLPVVIDSNASSDSAETFVRSRSRSVHAHVLGDIEPFTSERVQPIQNEKNVPVPTFDATMTKKDLVNTTLDWMYEVCGGDHFDCEGRRGENVLRLKVKTCGALSYICPLINRCIEESLVCHVSCPISTKNSANKFEVTLCTSKVSPQKRATESWKSSTRSTPSTSRIPRIRWSIPSKESLAIRLQSVKGRTCPKDLEHKPKILFLRPDQPV